MCGEATNTHLATCMWQHEQPSLPPPSPPPIPTFSAAKVNTTEHWSTITAYVKAITPYVKATTVPTKYTPRTSWISKCARQRPPIGRKKVVKNKKIKIKRKQLTHPEPLPPTMAIFFPAGTLNVIPCRIFCPGTYSKYTSSKVMVDVGGSICSTGAPTSLWHHRHKRNLCDDTCVKAISIQRHHHEHTHGNLSWTQHANGASRSKDTRHWWTHAGMHAHRHVCEYTYKHACIYMSYGHICVNANTSVHAHTCTHT